MKITHLSSQGWACGNYDEPISQKMIILGQNGSGKTSFLRQVQFVMEGSIEGFEKIPVRLMESFGASEKFHATLKLDLGLQFILDTGTSLTRLIERHPKGCSMSTIPKNPPAFNSFIFDMRQFFDLSAKKRQEYLFSLACSNSTSQTTVQSFFSQLGENYLLSAFKDSLYLYISLPYFEFLDAALKEAAKLKSQYNKEKLQTRANLDKLSKDVSLTEGHSQRIEQIRIELQGLAEERGKLQKEIEYNEATRRGLELIERNQNGINDAIRVLNSELELSKQYQVQMKALPQENINPKMLTLLQEESLSCQKNVLRQDTILKSLKDQAKIFEKGLCPTCGAEAKGKYQECVQKIEVVKKNIQVLTDAEDLASEKFENFRKKLAQWEKVNEERKNLTAFIIKDQKRLADIEECKKELVSLAQLEQSSPDIFNSLSEMERQIEGLREKEGSLQDELKQLEGQKHLEILAMKARQDFEQAEENWKEARKLEEQVQNERKRCLDDMIKPLFVCINENMPAGMVLQYDDNSDIIVNFRGKKVLFETISTGESALVIPGLIAGLLNFTKAEFKPVFIDNLEALDEDNRNVLLMKLSELVDTGKLDQFILAGCCELNVYGDEFVFARQGIEIKIFGQQKE